MQKIIYVVILIFAAAAFIYSDSRVYSGCGSNVETARGGKNQAGQPSAGNSAAAKKIEISGRLRLVGASRSAEMVVTPDGGADHYIAAEKSELEKLKPHQGKKVKAFGTHTVEEYKYPDARYNHTKNILIIERLEFFD
ncbi:MAG: hypothetical protein A2008_06520 [Candidatus Wallbacteria bacterium GWC2_49_35]|uniref:Uncharacterized protein n=1 Tax=Candidatus Wallbacteria bacterium GWC2_49_35 TaxID=1817813 RepID=A0A1F7WKJ4_9BACT|nr:MAG: hypothetical protein A2008_06520 [Candidatus Wallbacteria bacterium GWC2_49_35]HBC76408.1 hypothetical protein [Candidatus Wallbacteria bacterium]